MTARSSTSSSDQGLFAFYKALLAPSVLVCLALLLACEILVRVVMPQDKIAKGRYPNAEVRRQFIQYQKEAKVDMLIAGSSVAAVNFPPKAIDSALNQAGVKPFVSFNGGIRGCNMTCISQGTIDLYLSQKLPKYLLLVVSPEDLDSGNKTVIRRSEQFVNQLRRPKLSRWFQTIASDASKLFGFQQHVRNYLKSGSWEFDPAQVLTRGHVDMGSQERTHFGNSPAIETDSPLSSQLQEFVSHLTDRGINVIVLPTEGDSEARYKFTKKSRSAFSMLLHQLSLNPDVNLINADREGALSLYQKDSAYIDNLHLNSVNAQAHGELVGQLLYRLRAVQNRP